MIPELEMIFKVQVELFQVNLGSLPPSTNQREPKDCHTTLGIPKLLVTVQILTVSGVDRHFQYDKGEKPALPGHKSSKCL